MKKFMFFMLGAALTMPAMAENDTAHRRVVTIDNASKVIISRESEYGTAREPVRHYIDYTDYQPNPRYIERAGTEMYTVEPAASDDSWYISLRAQLNFLNFGLDYDTDWTNTNDAFDHDDYSFEMVFGGNAAVGKRFSNNWRGELEFGYTGKFDDADTGFTFGFTTPYAIANALYDIDGARGGIYVGGGLGLAFPTTTLDWDGFVQGGREHRALSPMAGLMLGYSRPLGDDFILDLRYRLAGWMGDTHRRLFQDTDDNIYFLDMDMGLVVENSVSVGLRYEF